MPDTLTTQLTPKQQLFVECYFACGFNATKAAIRAGYSKTSAHNQGSRLIRNDEVSAAIKKRMSESVMSAEEALARLSRHASADLADFYDIPEDPKTLPPAEKAQREADAMLSKMYPNAKDVVPDPNAPVLNLRKALDDGCTALIKSIKPGEFGWELTLVDSQSALDKILRVHGAYREQQQTTEALDLLRGVLIDDLKIDALEEANGDEDLNNGDEA